MKLFLSVVVYNIQIMNKDKLISLIIRKQTYKDTKSYLNDLLNLKQQSVKSSYQAIRQVLTTDYNAEAKLYAVRYLKDAFQKGNPSFISQVQKDILPILINISIDENDEKSIIKYAGSSFTKNEELSKFKAIVSSLFRMVKECIIKWAEWIPDSNRKFILALNELKKKSVSMDFEWKYFRPENEQMFKQCCEKNGLKLGGANPKPSVQLKAKQEQSTDPLATAIQRSLLKVKVADNDKDLMKIENDFNEAINNYLEHAQNFKEQFFQQQLDSFEKLKKEAINRIKSASVQKAKESAAPNPIPQILSNEKQIKKIDNTSTKPKNLSNNMPQLTHPQKNQISSQKNDQKISKKNSKTFKKQNNSSSNQPQKKQVLTSKVETTVKSSATKSRNNIKKQSNEQVKKIEDDLSIKLNVKTQEKIEEVVKVEVRSPRKVLPIRQKAVIQQLKVDKPANQSNSSKSLKLPTPKRGPIKFDQQNQSPSPLQKPSAKKESKIPSSELFKQSSSHKKQSKIVDISISKEESERINFSDEDSSEFSEQGKPRIVIRDFKKNSQLTPIKQETSRGPVEQNSAKQSSIPIKSSRMNEDESYISRDKKGGVTHKLMQENKHLTIVYQKLVIDYEAEKHQKLSAVRQKQALEKELRAKSQNEQRLIKKLKASIPIEDYNRLLKQLQQQKEKRQTLIYQNIKMRNKNDSLIGELNQTKYRLKIDSQTEKTKQKIHESQINILPINNQVQPMMNTKPAVSAPIIREQMDQDYIKNLTHTSNLHNWLNKINLTLFKRNVLLLSQMAYRDEYVGIMAKSSVYTQNNEQFLSMSITYQFKSLKQVKPQIRYKNCQQLDLWSKPLAGEEELYTQQLAVRLHCNPLKVIKTEVKIIQGIDITFLLPILYISFLREQQFSNEEFEDIFALKSQQLIKSKITQWNSQVIKQISDIQKLFKKSIRVGEKVRFCLSEGIDDHIFMAQFQILKNSKFLLRILPIPYSQQMTIKAKELMQNILFLLC